MKEKKLEDNFQEIGARLFNTKRSKALESEHNSYCTARMKYVTWPPPHVLTMAARNTQDSRIPLAGQSPSSIYITDGAYKMVANTGQIRGFHLVTNLSWSL